MSNTEEFDDLPKKKQKRERRMIVIGSSEIDDAFDADDAYTIGKRSSSRNKDRASGKPTSRTNGKRGH